MERKQYPEQLQQVLRAADYVLQVMFADGSIFEPLHPIPSKPSNPVTRKGG